MKMENISDNQGINNQNKSCLVILDTNKICT